MLNLIKAIGKAYFRAKGYYPANFGGHNYKLDPYHIAFWRAAANGTWEPATFDVISRYLTPKSTYIDLGAWIGATVLHASTRCKQVYCFEPDPTALHFLNWNVGLNDIRNVDVFGVAVAAENGISPMATFGDNPGDSMTSLLKKDADHFVQVLGVSWKSITELLVLEDVDLVKMDVEGAEFDLLPGMVDFLKTNRPALYLSTHAPYLDANTRVAQMQQIFESLDFYDTVVDENLKPFDRSAGNIARTADEFGTYLFTCSQK